MGSSVNSSDVSVSSAPHPSGAQNNEVIFLRRVLFFVLNISLYIIMLLWAGFILADQGWTIIDVSIFICLIFGIPWAILGFWNSLIGFLLLYKGGSSLENVAPFAILKEPEAKISLKIAIFMTLRNEDPNRALIRMKLIKSSLDETGHGDNFSYFLLSDTNKDDVAEQEEIGFAKWKEEMGENSSLFYRRRDENIGYKAGNVRNFVINWGDDYDLMLPLDADSLMDATTILHHVRIMQENPKLGILQSLVVGMPSDSAFARIFQFGMRQGMRSYTMGQAWWVGDCGPFWGHNALVRIAPFRDFCELPVLTGEPPFGGHILSHDQVEATFMRRAGYEVRVLPQECGSWEENPPTLIEFMKRNTRWCQGNLQYCKLILTKGLLPVSRFQLIWAILMFVGIPAWTLLLALAAIKPFDGEEISEFPAYSALCFYLFFIVINLAPKLFGMIDIVLYSSKNYGGTSRFVFSGIMEIIFSWILGASDTFRTSIFIVGLFFKKSVSWSGQARDVNRISWDAAISNLWPQTLFGFIIITIMAVTSFEFAIWSLPLTFGFLVSIPFAVFTAVPEVGLWFKGNELFMIPEEVEKQEIIVKAQNYEGANNTTETI